MARRSLGGLADGDTDDGDVSRDEIFDLISNYRRRCVLHYCRSADGSVELSDLAEQIAAWEQDKDVDRITSRERKTVYTSLQQTHLPRLERAGMIEFEDGEVSVTDEVRRLNIYLDIVPQGSIPWSVYYLGLSALSCVVVAGLGLGLLPTEPIPVLAYLAAIVLVFAVSAVYHVVVDYRHRLGDMEQPP